MTGRGTGGRPFARRLLTWYDANARDLPWRRRRDPWATWVSEVMLQQTRVEAVVDAFERFLSRFPDPARFASAGDDELLRAWRGLGYYQRARRLREGARQVLERHGGEVPADPDAIGALAGVGEYTRGAIASIAFALPEPAIDGNAERVFARHAGITADVKRASTRRRIREVVVERIDRARPGEFNQAVMDLGSMICTPRTPTCQRCPVADDCEGRRLGIADDLPRLPPRRTAVPVHSRAVLVTDRAGRVLGARIPDGEINAGQLELPGPGVLVDLPGGADELAGCLARRYGARFEIDDVVVSIRHGITHHRITLSVHAARLVGPTGGSLRFYRLADDAALFCTASRKALAKGVIHSDHTLDR